MYGIRKSSHWPTQVLTKSRRKTFLYMDFADLTDFSANVRRKPRYPCNPRTERGVVNHADACCKAPVVGTILCGRIFQKNIPGRLLSTSSAGEQTTKLLVKGKYRTDALRTRLGIINNILGLPHKSSLLHSSESDTLLFLYIV